MEKVRKITLSDEIFAFVKDDGDVMGIGLRHGIGPVQYWDIWRLEKPIKLPAEFSRPEEIENFIKQLISCVEVGEAKRMVRCPLCG